MKIATGEYGYDIFYFRRMLEAGATDVQQADATRCLGLTGFLQADVLCAAFSRPLSVHCAPALHLHAALVQPSSARLVSVRRVATCARRRRLRRRTPRARRG